MKKKPTRGHAKVQQKAKAKAQTKVRKPGHPTRRIEVTDIIPGEVILGNGDIVALQGRATVDLTVSNVGDRPIQVGSHCHFFEVNRALRFDRAQAFGMRLDIPAGTAVRFEPGDEREVVLVAFGGSGRVMGMNSLVQGEARWDAARTTALQRAASQGFLP